MADVGGREAEREAVWKIIQDACDEALRIHKFGVAAVMVTRALRDHGWEIVRSSGSAAQNQEEDPGLLHQRHMKHVELLRQQRDEARAERDALAARFAGSAAPPCAEEDHEWEMHCVRCGELWASGSAAQNPAAIYERALQRILDGQPGPKHIAGQALDRVRSSGSAAHDQEEHRVTPEMIYEVAYGWCRKLGLPLMSPPRAPEAIDQLGREVERLRSKRSPQDEDHEEPDV